MTTRNQRRNRKLAIARQSIAELEAIVTQLVTQLEEHTKVTPNLRTAPAGPIQTQYNTGRFADRRFFAGQQWTALERTRMSERAAQPICSNKILAPWELRFDPEKHGVIVVSEAP